MALPMVIYQRYRVRGSTWYGGSNINCWCGRTRQLMGSGAPWLWQGGWQTLLSVGIVRRAGGSHSSNGSPCWRARKIGRPSPVAAAGFPVMLRCWGRHR